jgi:hypothetical protein
LALLRINCAQQTLIGESRQRFVVGTDFVSSLLARVFGPRPVSDTVPLERRCTGFAGVRRGVVVGYKTGAPRKLNARRPGDEDADPSLQATRLVPTEQYHSVAAHCELSRRGRHDPAYNLAPDLPADGAGPGYGSRAGH